MDVQDTGAAGARPASFLAAAAALGMMDAAARTARTAPPDHTGQDDPGQALAALLMLRHLREELAGWETGLIETARDAGATWADLAEPLGVQSRQAAERRYLRLRPNADAGTVAGSTGEQRVQATRAQRAGDRAVTTWARDNAADLRRLAGQIGALDDLSAQAAPAIERLLDALGHHDPARLLAPLAETRPLLEAGHRKLADRLDQVTARTDQLRADSDRHRRTPPARP
ncbi:type III effector protein [Streptomyces sp. SP17BM10]|uniref:type III effector protein n=1 Tax=Streptomyces sp. SP17BM10 TaxID=3002530 RepID=UPI002E7A1BB7|nr:type III effector protein [Streptomyces sp. SP17BM10]MEE1781922.1 type III effector protein [Streptomyces sp. SP17BM10]